VVWVSLEGVESGRARLLFEAPREVEILRGEVVARRDGAAGAAPGVTE